MNDITTKIYEKIFKKINDQYIDVFLCGGVSRKKNKSIRDLIREKLINTKDIRILYPEDLFIEILTIDKKSDLLTLERVLAKNCDLICIVAESAGSLVELGAFVNNDKTKEKVIALVDEKRKKDKSFIMLGPIKYLKKFNKKQVIFYNNNNIEKVSIELKKFFKQYKKGKLSSRKVDGKNINNIIGIYNYIPLLLYFYTEIEASNLKKSIKEVYLNQSYKEEKFLTLFKSGIKLLYKEKFIYKNLDYDKTKYKLTQNGYDFVYNLLSRLEISNRRKLYDSIRFDIMEEKYYQ